MPNRSRRDVLRAAGALSVLSISGCTGGDDDSAPTTTATPPQTDDGHPSPTPTASPVELAADAFTAPDRWALRYRSPDRRKATPATVEGTDLEIDWEYATGNRMRGPAVADGTAFVATETGGDPERPVIDAVAMASGKRIWRRRAAAFFDGPGLPGAPICAGSAVIARMGGRYVALAAADGTELWHSPDLGRPTAPPTVVGSNLVVLTDGGCSAIDLTDGSVHWEAPAGGPFWPVARDGIVVVPDGDRWVAYEADSGEARWDAHAVTNGLAPIGGASNVPTAIGDVVIAELGRRSNGGRIEDTGVYALSLADGSVQWQNSFGGDWTNRAGQDGMLYALAGDRALAVETATGEVQWDQSIQDATEGSPGELLVAGDRLHWVSDHGVLHTMQADDGTFVGTQSLIDRPPDRMPVVLEDAVGIRTLAGLTVLR